MAHFSLLQGIELAGGGIRSYITNRPIVVSYEVTLSCNCDCHHCDLGGLIKDEKQIKPEEYGDLTQRLKPLVAQISGGEPLLRKDIAAIVRAIKQAGAQYLILVTNGALLNESNYLHLTSLMSGMMNFDDGRVSINVWSKLFPG
jgi:MoaA/NifB/PqqE/SkfB family radical SAM enzyme